MNNIYLSKSRYCKARQCKKIIWLKKYKPEYAIQKARDIVLENGFSFIEEPSHETSIHRTFVFEKSLEPTRNQNGCTLNRKQTQGIN